MCVCVCMYTPDSVFSGGLLQPPVRMMAQPLPVRRIEPAPRFPSRSDRAELILRKDDRRSAAAFTDITRTHVANPRASPRHMSVRIYLPNFHSDMQCVLSFFSSFKKGFATLFYQILSFLLFRLCTEFHSNFNEVTSNHFC